MSANEFEALRADVEMICGAARATGVSSDQRVLPCDGAGPLVGVEDPDAEAPLLQPGLVRCFGPVAAPAPPAPGGSGDRARPSCYTRRPSPTSRSTLTPVCVRGFNAGSRGRSRPSPLSLMAEANVNRSVVRRHARRESR